MRVWVVPVRMGDMNLKILVDTGAATTLLDEDLSARLKLEKRRGFSVKLMGVESRETKARRVMAREFRIGSYLVPEAKMLMGNIGA